MPSSRPSYRRTDDLKSIGHKFWSTQSLNGWMEKWMPMKDLARADMKNTGVLEPTERILQSFIQTPTVLKL